MEGLEQILLKYGIRVPDIVAGFAGGVVNAIALKRSDVWSIISSVMAGAITANYFGPALSTQFSLAPTTAGFLIGIGGMAVVQGLIEAMKHYRPFGHNNGGNGTGGSNAG